MSFRNTITLIALFGLILTVGSGCGGGAADMRPHVTQAVAILHPTMNSQVAGQVIFMENAEGAVSITAKITGLTPGLHGFHIHTYGDLRGPEGKSAGGHYNPFDREHGAPTDANRHVGDLGNVDADTNGQVDITWTDPVIRLNGAQSIIGRAVVVHAGEDDLVSQPTGGAGARVAAGVIGVANPNWNP